MSLRVLYRKIPASKRICKYYRCQQPILRNIDRDKDGHIYHHGCLMSAQDEKWRCLECFVTFDATEAAFVETQDFRNEEFHERLKAVCPNCGSHNVKSLSSAEVIVDA
jgi:hypothetical protein